MTLEKLNLTRPEKAAVIAAICIFRINRQPTMQNIDSWPIKQIKKIMENLSIITMLSLVCEEKVVSSLVEKIRLGDEDE